MLHVDSCWQALEILEKDLRFLASRLSRPSQSSLIIAQTNRRHEVLTIKMIAGSYVSF